MNKRMILNAQHKKDRLLDLMGPDSHIWFRQGSTKILAKQTNK